MTYPPNILTVVCPVCQAAVGARCLEKVRDGNQWRKEPHAGRVAKTNTQKETNNG